jgi:hypothetical protein
MVDLAVKPCWSICMSGGSVTVAEEGKRTSGFIVKNGKAKDRFKVRVEGLDACHGMPKNP